MKKTFLFLSLPVFLLSACVTAKTESSSLSSDSYSSVNKDSSSSSLSSDSYSSVDKDSSSSADEEEVFSEGDFDYIKTQYGLSVVSYYGNNKIINIPETINGETVTGIGCPDTRFYVGDTRQKNYRALKAILPKTVKRIDGNFLGSQCPNVTSVEGLESIEICNYGLGFTEEAIFSNNLKVIGDHAFNDQKYVVIPDDIDSFPNQLTGLVTKKIDLIRGKGEQKIKNIDGVIYSIDEKTLLCYPSGRDAYSYTIPDTVTTLGRNAFDNLGYNLSELTIPSSVTNMNAYSITGWNIFGCEFVVEEGSRAFDVVTEVKASLPEDRVFISTSQDESSPHKVVEKAVRECCGNKETEYDKALALHDWLIDYVEYDYTYKNSKATQMLKNKTGICAAYAETYHWLLNEANIENEIVGNFDHAWIGAKLDGKWTYIDPTWDDVEGDELDRHTYFGFDNTVRNTVYGASSPDFVNTRIAYLDNVNASLSDNHYYVKKGYLSEDFNRFKNTIQKTINERTSIFNIAANITFSNTINNVSYMILAGLLSNYSYIVNGEEYHVDCYYDNGEFHCYPIKKSEMQLSTKDFDVSFKNGMAKIEKYRGKDNEIVVPETINDLSVGYIGRAFAQNNDIVSVTLPNSIVEIEGNAFIYCLGLESINIPSSIKRIDDFAFAYCENLRSDIILPEGLTYLGSMAFGRCFNITKASIPSTIETFRDMAFSDCLSLSSVTLNQGLEMLGIGVFAGCTNLTEITLPDSLLAIGTNAFGETGITKINIPAKVSYLGFGEMGFVSIGDIFYKLHLEELTVDPNNRYFKMENNALIDIETHTLHRVVDTKIGKEYHIADGVSKIASRSFINANKLETLYIPTSVTSIGSECFCNGCDNFKTIVYAGTMEQWKAITLSDYWNEKDDGLPLAITINCSDGVISQ